MKLIIAEKPSLGRNIVDAINGIGTEKMQKKSGYYEGAGYIVTWAFGHLFSLADIEHYTGVEVAEGEKARWDMSALPCFPDKFSFALRPDDNGKPDSGVISQFKTIKSLCLRADVDTIINAGDADREGEIIVRICITKAFEDDAPDRTRNTKNGENSASASESTSLASGENSADKTEEAVTSADGDVKKSESVGKKISSSVTIPESKALKRLWLPDQTPETIRAALSDMKDSGDYDLLAYEGYARTFIDWLYGVNLTRYATLKCGTLIRVGRVIVPIVKAVYDRDMQIKNFVPEPYYALVSKAETSGEEIELTSKKRFTADELAKAEAECARMNALTATVTSVKKKKAKLPPGKLYSLTKLQNVLSKKFKMPMNESLAIAQKLYEQGYLTYPRTNSEYLATAEKDKMKQILAGVAKLGYPVKFRDDKSIFDDSKIEAHSALTPTFKIPPKGALSEKETQLYSTVFRRFVAVFCANEALVNRTEIVISLGEGEEEFTLKGTVILEKGWTEFDDSTQKDKVLPDLKKGDTVAIDFQPCEKTTSPPKHYTVETLNNYLKNPFREDKARAEESESDDEDYRAIFEGLELGTEATRTGIIDNALKSGYMALNKDVYTILPKGEYMIEQLLLLGISMDKYKTSQLGQALKKVYKGQLSIRGSLRLAQQEIAAVFASNSPVSAEKDFNIGLAGEEVGVCPVCGKGVVRGRYGYECAARKEGCAFRIPLSLCKRPIPISAARQMLAGEQTAKLEGFVSKNGKRFAAALKLKDGRAEFVFDN